MPRPRGPNEPRVIERLGLAVLAETYDHGRHVGYKIMCCRHTNADDVLRESPPCQKVITMGVIDGGLEKEECQRRLKRWFIGGAVPLIENSWPADQKRFHHVWRYGGPRLHELASDENDEWSDEELNDTCRQITYDGLPVLPA